MEAGLEKLSNDIGIYKSIAHRHWRGFGFEMFTDASQYVAREFEVARPRTLSERVVTVALAVSLDNDYFSTHGGCCGVIRDGAWFERKLYGSYGSREVHNGPNLSIDFLVKFWIADAKMNKTFEKRKKKFSEHVVKEENPHKFI
ncbi:hypothetical protein L2E82_45483 [Cichorium intybus]|uniref:Uncharacterized protein n=1 Tax=Cichorium intybus TaxID=13427 RepID=A0ACB8ZS82_CICIN|nr:hypothetical protein L2E82_45483 [Cichorium intybus]